MLGLALALLLIVVVLTSVAALIHSLVSEHGAIHRVIRTLWIAFVARRESTDLDRRYERLLRG